MSTDENARTQATADQLGDRASTAGPAPDLVLSAVLFHVGSSLVVANAVASAITAAVYAEGLIDSGPVTAFVPTPWWPGLVGLVMLSVSVAVWLRRRMASRNDVNRAERLGLASWLGSRPASRISFAAAIAIGVSFMIYGIANSYTWTRVYYPEFGVETSPDPLFAVGGSLGALALVAFSTVSGVLCNETSNREKA